MTGIYMLNVLYEPNSEEMDWDTETCEPLDDETLIADVKMRGNQIFLEIQGEPGLFGIMNVSGGINFITDNPGFVTTDGNFDQSAQSFMASFTETQSTADGSLTCSGAADITGEPPAPVSEESQTSTGITWFEAEDWSGTGMLDYEYGTIRSGAPETEFFWDSFASVPGWVENTEVDPEHVLSPNGIAVLDDAFIVDGFVNAGEIAIVRDTVLGTPSDLRVFHIELEAFDVSNLDIQPLINEDFAMGLPDIAIFGSGAQILVGEITTQNNVYGFECDRDDRLTGMICQNAYITARNGDTLTTASTLNEVINITSEFQSGIQGVEGLGLDHGTDAMGEYVLALSYMSSDGTTAGTELSAVLTKHYFNGADDQNLGQIPVTVNTSFAPMPILETVIPEDIARMAHLDDERRHPFVFVDSELESLPTTRVGFKEVADMRFKEMFFNSIATENIVTSFMPPVDNGPTGPSDPTDPTGPSDPNGLP